jgi:DNA polymerase-3 subunit alpha
MNAPDLHCHSTFSILDGIGKPEDVVARAKTLKWPAAALTEHGWMGSAPLFYKACKEQKIKPILGCELYVVPDEWLGVQDKSAQKKSYHLTTLALSAEGYHNLVAWTTFANRRDDEYQNYYHKPRISLSAMEDVAPFPLHHNVVFSGCLSSELLRFMLDPSTDGNLWSGALAYIEMMKGVFPNFYLEFQNHYIKKFADNGFDQYDQLLELEKQVHPLLWQLHKMTKVPTVVTNDSHMQEPAQRKPHLAMKLATWQHHEGAMDHMDASKQSEALNTYSYFANYMRSMEEIADGIPHGDKAIQNLFDIVEEADIRLDPLDKFSYSIPDSGYSNPVKRIRKRSARRLGELKKKHGKLALERFEHELDSMGDFAHYLMIMSDIIKNAREQGIRTHTRGSAANSIVCYCLGIHDIDSLYYKLTFERFYNPSRKKLPDIDVDINPDRYEDFMHFVQEYMAEREGEGQVVQICNYGTLANRSAFRMMAESQGIPKETVDEIAKILPSMIDSGMVGEEDDAFELIKEEYPQVYELTAGVFDSIKSISQHACAWLFGTRERPVKEWVPLSLIASSNTLVTQYNYKIIDKQFGLVKGDFLRLKTLSVMDKTLEFAKQPFDFEIPLNDKKTYKMLTRGDTEGVHSMQGKTQRLGCTSVKPENIFDVVAIQALYRPSGTRTGFDKQFVNRRKGKAEIPERHPIVANVLGETYGLPIYQEQILDIAYAIGFTHDEAQELLDAIKMAKGVGRGAAEAFDVLKPLFMKKAKAAGLKKEDRLATWKDWDAFQGYGFNKGHATSYGILAVQTAYLKRHFTREFFTALLDVYPDKSKYIAAARASGFGFDPADINLSQSGFTTGSDRDKIRVGLSRVKHLGPVAVREIIAGQPFSSFDDFKERTTSRALNKTRIDVLSAIGAFDSLGVERSPELIIERKEKGTAIKRVYTGPDEIDFALLGFTVGRPEAFEGVRPQHTVKYDKGGEWSHKGLQDGVELTEGPVSVSKLFWIPPFRKLDLYSKKASAWAKVKTNLLLAVDVNGIAFEIKANEDKPEKVEILDFLASKCRGAVVCLDGAVRQPFLFDGPLTFQLFNVSGAFKEDAQLWMDHEKVADYKLAIEHLTRKSRKYK